MSLEDNIVIAFCADSEPQLGRQKVRIRRKKGEPYHWQWINVIRKATYEEYVEYHKREGLDYNKTPPSDKIASHFFALYMD